MVLRVLLNYFFLTLQDAVQMWRLKWVLSLPSQTNLAQKSLITCFGQSSNYLGPPPGRVGGYNGKNQRAGAGRVK